VEQGLIDFPVFGSEVVFLANWRSHVSHGTGRRLRRPQDLLDGDGFDPDSKNSITKTLGSVAAAVLNATIDRINSESFRS
jgi:hypothetical protein